MCLALRRQKLTSPTHSDVMNEKSVLQISIYDRSVEEEMFLGLVELRPKLVNGHTVDQWFTYVEP